MKMLTRLFYTFLTTALVWPSACQQPPGTNDTIPATLVGRACYGSEYLLRNQVVRLFTWEQGREVRKRMEILGRAQEGPHGIANDTSAEMQFANDMHALMRKLPSKDKANTDVSGRYRFTGLTPGAQYLIVSELVAEDGYYFGARPTPIVKPAESLSLDLMITNVPWEMSQGNCSKATAH